MTTVGQDFMRCPNCGPICDVDEERSTLQTLVLYCHHCGASGEIERLRVADLPVRWTRPGKRAQRKTVTGNVSLTGGQTMAGTVWVQIEGPRDEVIGALKEDLQEEARELIYRFEDA